MRLLNLLLRLFTRSPKPATGPMRPKLKGLTAVEREHAVGNYHLEMRRYIAARAASNRERCVRAGIKEYRWLAVPQTACDLCDIARRNNSKTFSYLRAPPEGHVGEGRCNAPDWCRCMARSIIPGFH